MNKVAMVAALTMLLSNAAWSKPAPAGQEKPTALQQAQGLVPPNTTIPETPAVTGGPVKNEAKTHRMSQMMFGCEAHFIAEDGKVVDGFGGGGDVALKSNGEIGTQSLENSLVKSQASLIREDNSCQYVAVEITVKNTGQTIKAQTPCSNAEGLVPSVVLPIEITNPGTATIENEGVSYKAAKAVIKCGLIYSTEELEYQRAKKS